MYTPGFSALKRNGADWPGATWVASPPASGPVAACRAMLWLIVLSGAFLGVTSTVSAWGRRSGTRGVGRAAPAARHDERAAHAQLRVAGQRAERMVAAGRRGRKANGRALVGAGHDQHVSAGDLRAHLVQEHGGAPA